MFQRIFHRAVARRLALAAVLAAVPLTLCAAPSQAATHTCVRDGNGWITVNSSWSVIVPYYSPPMTFVCVMGPSNVYSSGVGDLQIALRVCHRYSIEADGYFGPQTTSVLKAFQRAHGLTADGIYGPNTAKKLSWLSYSYPGGGTTGPCYNVASKIK